MIEPEASQPMPDNRKCPQCGTPLPAGTLAGLCPACLLKQGAANDTAAPDSPAFVPPSIEEIAKLFPQLDILSLLGKGGMGAVYKARQPSLDRLVALKILPSHDGSDPGFAERFTREARALAKLSHPNIVGVHEFGVAGNLHYFIMEFVDGVNLRQLQLSGRLSPREALQIVPQLCDALQYAHDQGVVHRDIKPENVMLDRKGRVKIADFGIAKMLDQGTQHLRLTGEGHVIGTPHYMSPEQVEHPLEVDHRADIYSLGVVFYEMLTGELPLGRFSPPSRKVQIDIRLDDVVLRALEKEPDRRYQHASQVKTAVENIGNSPGATPPPSAAAASALSADLLSRDYNVDIGYCLRRGFNLVKGDFWPLVGVTAIILALFSVVNSNHLTAFLSPFIWGPLMGGLYLYYFKKIRREPVTIETAFSGFSSLFLHLFLGGFVSFALTFLGIICFVLPGIYLAVSWIFAFPLIADKRLHFWDAMELSRKLVRNHWWRIFCFSLVLIALNFAGLLAFGIGIFLTVPISLAALAYAYEDIFNVSKFAQVPPPISAMPADLGPSGTVVMPPAARIIPPSGGGGCLKGLAIGCGGIVLLAAIIASTVAIFHWHDRRQYFHQQNEAVTEHWSPPPGSDPIDPLKILEEARKLRDAGKYAEAHQRYLWFFNHALEYNPGTSGVRLSYALTEWYELGRRYPAAHSAIEQIRDRDRMDFYEGRGYAALFTEFAALNHYLQNEDETVNVFDSFRENDRDLAQQCFPQVEELLVKRHDYKECLEYIPDPDAAFDSIEQTWDRAKQMEDSQAELQSQMQKRTDESNENLRRQHPDAPRSRFVLPPLPKTADNNFINQTRQLIEILVATGSSQKAESIRGRAIHAVAQEKIDNHESGSLGDPRLDSAVIDAQRKIEGRNSIESSSDGVDSSPPVVVRTEPASGEREVAPGHFTLKVTFSKPMANNAWSWCDAWSNSTPVTDGQPSFAADHETCLLNVTLEPNKTYAYWLNAADGLTAVGTEGQKLAENVYNTAKEKYNALRRNYPEQNVYVQNAQKELGDAERNLAAVTEKHSLEQFQNFKDTAGHPAVPYLLIFHTGDSANADRSSDNNNQTK
ncbi:MAG TPA: protein kinase [Verrucomicrobiae bacterium]|jgi:hypothetical protein|nr:protein kinase [Verrucomicrobiae bacterium]